MRKLIFVLSIISLGFVSVSCSTDAYDLPETEELKAQTKEESISFILDEEENLNFYAKEGDEDTSESSDTTNPPVGGVKKD